MFSPALEVLRYLETTNLGSDFECYVDGIVEELIEKRGMSKKEAKNIASFKNVVLSLEREQKEYELLKKENERLKDLLEKITSDSREVDTKRPQKVTSDSFEILFEQNGFNTTKLVFDTETYEKALLITGETKDIKDKLKVLGGKWNNSVKGWIFSKKTLMNHLKEE